MIKIEKRTTSKVRSTGIVTKRRSEPGIVIIMLATRKRSTQGGVSTGTAIER
jgi:hypothetical protein